MKRIHLSAPHMSGREIELVREAFESNWIAPLGPHVDAFESEFADLIGVSNAAALSSGTAALHLALRLLDLKPGDEVLCSTLTFSASSNVIVYEGATPVFIDCDEDTWNMDPNLLREELRACARRGKLPRAVIVVDLYGQCADYDAILEICGEYDVPVIEDAAEALGATYKGRMAGSFGTMAAFSFNGNKIITTSGGGMLVSSNEAYIRKARFLATQAKDPALHYQHSQIGFNYRMSNILAAIGRGQLAVLPARVRARCGNFEFYRRELGHIPGLHFMPEAAYGHCNRWLTCLVIDAPVYGVTRDDLLMVLDSQNIDARPVWKPLHLQPVFCGCRSRGGRVSEQIFENGICLPSGSSLTESDLFRVCAVIRQMSWLSPVSRLYANLELTQLGGIHNQNGQ